MVPSTAPPTVSPYRWFFLAGNLLIIAALVALAVFSAHQSQVHHRRLARIALDNLSLVLANNLGAVIAKTDLSLRTIALEVDRQVAQKGAIDPVAMDKFLAEQQALQPEIHSLRLAGPDGVIRYGTGVPSGSDASVANLDYFVRLHNDPQAGLTISSPYLARIGNRWIVTIARRLNRPDGSFAGVVYAAITTEHFRAMLSALALGPRGSVALQTPDRRLIVRIPETGAERATEPPILPEPSRETLRAHPEYGTFTAVSPLDQIERQYVYRRVSGLPLYIMAGQATQDSSEAWREEVFKLAAIIAAFGLFTLWLLHFAQDAAERQQAARQLLQEAVDSIDAGFSIFDREDRLVVCNNAYRSLHPVSRDLLVPGVAFEEIARHKAAARRFPEGPPSREAWLQERLRRHRLADGTPFEQITDRDRHLLSIERRTASGYTVSNQMDITELAQYRDRLEKLADERTAQLQAALGQFRIFVEQVPTAMAMLDKDMSYLAASVRWMQKFGAHVDRLIGRNHYEVHPDLPESWREALRAALAGIPQEKDEALWVKADGSHQWLSWAVYPWRNEHGGIGGIIIAADDITGRKRAEESARIAQARFRCLFEANMVGIVIADSQGRIIDANDYYLDVLGCTRQDLAAGKVDWREMTPPEWLPADERALAELRSAGVCVPYEKEYVRRDGSRRTVFVADALLPDEGEQILALIVDITGRKRAEEQVRQLNAGLERQVEKRTAELALSNEALLRSNLELQHFAHAVAHDLQTPLRSIVGFTQLLQQATEGCGNERMKEWSSLVIDNTKRLHALIRSLLSYTRLEAQGLPFEVVDLGEVAKEVLASMTVLIEETGAEVSLGRLPDLSVDRFQIAQVLQNLLENGIRYNHSKPPRVSIASESLDGEWLFSVADNGIGIDPRHHERIFQIFHRLHTYSEVPGTGIGLALCRRIVERHGGRIWVESRSGEGSTFYFTLPAAGASP